MSPSPQTSSPRFQPAQVRKRQILDAAASLAVSRGLDNVSIALVAQAAGVAKGSIYLHYESRTAVIDALRADLWHTMLDAPRRIVKADGHSWVERCDAIVEHLVDFSMTHEELYHAVFHATASTSDEPWLESRAVLRELIDGGVSAGEFHVLEPEITTDFLLHAYAGPCYHSDDRQRLVTALQLLFRRVLGVA